MIEGNGGGRWGNANASSIGGWIGSCHLCEEFRHGEVYAKLYATYEPREYPPCVKYQRQSSERPEERLPKKW